MTTSERPLVMAGWNLALRFLLELAALAGLALLAWHVADGWIRVVLAVVAPLTAAVVWGGFNVRGDPSRSGRSPIRVDGRLRLAIELAVLGIGGWGLWTWSRVVGVVDLALVAFHYAVSWRRVVWLVGARRRRS